MASLAGSNYSSGGYTSKYAILVQNGFTDTLNQFSKEMKAVEKQVNETSKRVSNAMRFKDWGDKLGDFGRKLSIGISAPLGAFTLLSLRAAANIQTVQRSIKNFVNDPKMSDEIFNKMDKMADASIFKLNDYADAAKTLLGSGAATTSTVVNRIKELADVAAVYDIPMSTMAEQAATAKQFGFGMRQARQMAMQGIPVYKELQKYLKTATGKTFNDAQMKKLLSENRISGKAYEAIIHQLTQKGSPAFQGMESNVKGLAGSYKLLRNAIEKVQEKIGLSLDKNLGLSNSMQDAARSVNKFAASFTEFSDKHPEIIKNIAGIGGILITLPPILAGVAWGLKALSATMMLNPVILALTALAAAIYLIYTNWDKLKASFTSASQDAFVPALASFTGGINPLYYGKKLFDFSTGLYSKDKASTADAIKNGVNSSLDVRMNIYDPKGYIKDVQADNSGINKFDLGVNSVVGMAAG